MMPFYAPFNPFNPYNHRRANNYYSPYNNLHNNNLESNNLRENPCFPSVSSRKEQGNFDCSSNNTILRNDSKNISKNNNYYSKKDNSDNNNDNNNNNSNNNENECIGEFNNSFFEIFGLKLAFDDLLIIAMLFFLYKEEVNDTYLYIALILLLLT